MSGLCFGQSDVIFNGDSNRGLDDLLEGVVEPVEKLSELEKAFLKDVVDNPESGVAARYKRLGTS